MASMNGPSDGRQDSGEEGRSPSFMRLFGQMVMLPFTVFVQGMELFIKTIQGMQRATDEGMNVMVGEMGPAPGTATGSRGDLESGTTGPLTEGAIKDDDAGNLKEKKTMDDKDLSDDKKLKLVRYKILFIRRDLEVAFPEREELVSDSMDDSGYTAWKVAEFIQRLNDTDVPQRWGGGTDQGQEPRYPRTRRPDSLLAQFQGGRWVLSQLPEDDKKYLRVYFEVLDRYDREEFKYQERQIDVLEEIRDRI
jgi:hypothetical protein